jgi:hypothetical protein
MTHKKMSRLFFFISAIILSVCLCSLFSVFAQENKQTTAVTDLKIKIVEARSENQRPRFGDTLKLQVRLQNAGTTTITLSSSSLFLEQKGWAGWGRLSSGWSTEIPLSPEVEQDGAMIIEPGKSILLTGEDSEITANILGRMQAIYALKGATPLGKKLLPKDSTIKVDFEVIPSELITAVWNADTDKKRQTLLPQIRTLLDQQNALPEDYSIPRNREFIDGNLQYMAGALIPLLEILSKDIDLIMRGQAIPACGKASRAVGNMNAFLESMDRGNKRPDWAKELTIRDEKEAEQACTKLAFAGLKDKDGRVRIAAIRLFASRRNGSAIDLVKQLTTDADASVREEAQKYLSQFASATGATEALVASLSDSNAGVREQALAGLERSPKPPALESLKQAYKSSGNETALRLMNLLFEQENDALPAVFFDNFKKRSLEERLKIMTLIAGHTDAATLELITMGLQDPAPEVQRVAVMRLASVPSSRALPLMQAYAGKISPKVKPLAQTAQLEIAKQPSQSARESGNQLSIGRETDFPSKNGTVPMVSPDGQYVAYVETGWGRPGGSGGLGRSNMKSLTHIIKSDGKDDRIVSDMFLVQWMPDSKSLASARDGYIAITDLHGDFITEFGPPVEEKYLRRQQDNHHWTTPPFFPDLGIEMPHQKRFAPRFDLQQIYDSGENAAFSPDGKWFGPILEKRKVVFFDENWQRLEIKMPQEYFASQWQCTWSPDGKYILMIPYGGNDDIYRPYLVDFQARTLHLPTNIGSIPKLGDWEYRKSRWNPWSKDGSRMTFVNDGQIWIADADGSNAKQVTFDSVQKIFPVLSRDGKRIAYITWQPDNRLHYERMGPTNIWVVDIDTTLAMRVTLPAPERITCLDWLDNNTLIFDRVSEGFGGKSSLKVLSLSSK